MTILSGGCSVIQGGEYTGAEGTRRFKLPISRAMGARDIAQSVSTYSAGASPARRNPVGEEVLYVVSGLGAINIDGHRYPLAEGTGVYIPPGSIYQIENTGDEGELEIVSVCCPEDDGAESGVSPVAANSADTKPFRTVRESDQPAIPAGDREFRLLASQDIGCKRVTQFVGVIPPGRAAMHHHTYEEAIYILEGDGRVWTEDGSAPFSAGTSIYLPRGASHSLENTGMTNVRLLGVFHPSGSPANRHEEEG
ncbi:MAG TPA: cupin domain-containing protein [Blastocatellia bacterium]|nr:cupin domain-containing protein [Blastocatellia bacterium]